MAVEKEKKTAQICRGSSAEEIVGGGGGAGRGGSVYIGGDDLAKGLEVGEGGKERE